MTGYKYYLGHKKWNREMTIETVSADVSKIQKIFLLRVHEFILKMRIILGLTHRVPKIKYDSL